MNYTPTEHVPRKPPGDTCASGQAPPPFLLGMGRTGQADLISWWPRSHIKTELCRATKVLHKGPHTDNTNPNGSAMGLGWHSDSHPEASAWKGLWACARRPLGPAWAPASAHQPLASRRLPTRAPHSSSPPPPPHRMLSALGAVPVPPAQPLL